MLGLPWWSSSQAPPLQCGVPFLVWEDLTCHKATEPVSYEPQLPSLCAGAHLPQLPSPRAAGTKPACSRARAVQQEKPLQREARGPQLEGVPTLLNYRKLVRSNGHPAQPK